MIHSDRLYLDQRSKTFIKLNCLITLIALAIASRLDLGKLLTRSLGLLEGQQTMADEALSAPEAGRGDDTILCDKLRV